MSDKMNPIQAKPGRRSGVELLRMLAAMAVIVLHFNYYPGSSGATDYAVGFNRAFLNLLECVCICAVNVFLLISGAFGSRGKRIKIRKLGLLLLQTSVFRFAANVVSCIVAHDLNVGKLLSALIPVNYYVILYVSLMLVSPFINAGLERLSDAALRRLALIAFLVFSAFSTLVDVAGEVSGNSLSGLSPVGIDGSMGGYTIVNFALMYLLGAWLGREERSRTKLAGTPLLATVLALSVLLLYLWRAYLPQTAWMYSNPLVIVEACAAFLLFSRMRFSSRWINRIAPAAFTCYLIHEYALYFLDYQKVGLSAFPIMLGTLALIVLGIYGLSAITHFIWNSIIARLFPDRSGGLTISAE